MRQIELKIIRNKSTRRFLVELFVGGTLIVLVTMSVVEPYLLSRFPSVFPEAPVRGGAPRAWVPETRLGWFTACLNALLLGLYMYYRIAFTELGEDMTRLVEMER